MLLNKINLKCTEFVADNPIQPSKDLSILSMNIYNQIKSKQKLNTILIFKTIHGINRKCIKKKVNEIHYDFMVTLHFQVEKTAFTSQNSEFMMLL